MRREIRMRVTGRVINMGESHPTTLPPTRRALRLLPVTTTPRPTKALPPTWRNGTPVRFDSPTDGPVAGTFVRRTKPGPRLPYRYEIEVAGTVYPIDANSPTGRTVRPI